MSTTLVSPLPTQTAPIRKTSPAGIVLVRRRAAAVLAAVWLLGALPSILRLGLGWNIPAGLEAFGWGLWLPGAGFVAVGGWWLLMIPVVWILLEAALLFWALAGMLMAPAVVWLGMAFLAAAVADEPVFPHAVWIVPIAAVAVVLWKVVGERRLQAREATRGTERARTLPPLLADLEQRAASAPDRRELDTTQLAAARYLFDLALQPVGELEGFTHIDNFQGASLRYQLNYISYALAALQCRYTPNFHGYLNQAQRFAIESLTLPKVCGYWKWEYAWGRFAWNPDPVGTLDNVMLTGWSQVALTTYAANTGDLRYQAEGALPFKPFRRRERIYGHDAHSFATSIVGNWRRASTKLYACEPHWVFPLCNAYAYAGLVPYDRVNGTRHAARHHAALVQQLEADYLLADGDVKPVVNTLTGWSWLGRKVPPQAGLSFLLHLARVANAFHPGYARRWYLIVREQFVSIDPTGRLQLRGLSWDSLMDAGNYRKNPAYMLGLLAQAAREQGDEAVATAALRELDLRLKRVSTPGVLAYEGVSTAANINVAGARLAAFGDWQTLIVRGPDPATLDGPVLADCAYPDVLVAAARGDVDGLDLVLLPGRETGPQTLRIERLQPNSRYRVDGATVPSVRTSGSEVGATLTVVLDGRTEVRLRRERGESP